MKIPYIGIANIILDSLMYPEYVQGSAQPEALKMELLDCIDNPDRVSGARKSSEQLRAILDHPAEGGAGSWLQSFIEAP